MIKRVYGYRNDNSFKIWFDTDIDEDANKKDIRKQLTKEVKKVNKKHGYRRSRKIAIVEVDNEVYYV